MKKAGWLLIVVSALIIFWNVVVIRRQNERQMAAHPYVTLFSGGENLKPAYTFWFPLTGYELAVYSIGILGLCLLFIAGDDK